MNTEPQSSDNTNAPETSYEVAQAMQVMKEGMRDDPDYAHSWHCNIAMACQDAINHQRMMNEGGYIDGHSAGNDAARRFMKKCFDVDTKA